METRSFPGSAFTRSFHKPVNTCKHSSIAAQRSSLEDTTPAPGIAVAASDQNVNLCRLSNGKSNSVASICVVSSMETSLTQSNSVSRGNSSRMLQTLLRIRCSRRLRLAGATTGCAIRRCSSCFGGSIEIKLGSVYSSYVSTMPIVGSEEKISGEVSTCMMSLYLVMDQ